MGAFRRLLPPVAKGMSARLLVLTAFFVMLSEVLIYVPSASRFRLVYLEGRIESAHLASLALKATPDYMISKDLERELLTNAAVRGIVIKKDDRRSLMLSEDMPPAVDASFDIRDPMILELIRDTFDTLRHGDRTIRVIGHLPDGSEGNMDVLMDEAALHDALLEYSINILQLSIVISLITAGLVYLALHLLFVRPMRRITHSMIDFRKAPEGAETMITTSLRTDEIGTAERELHHMQSEIRSALKQRSHLAALGSAVSKINHDLRNMLATAQLVSDGLANVQDPTVRRVAPRLMQTIGRAIDLCTQTLNYGRTEEAPPTRDDFALRDLVEEVGDVVGLPTDGRIVWQNRVDGELVVNGDREQILRVLMNLGRNAIEAMPEGGRVTVQAYRHDGHVIIEFADNGPGLPETAIAHLFEPFAGSGRRGGTGLGLAIAHELVAAHGGELSLAKSDTTGTTFQVDLPGKPS